MATVVSLLSPIAAIVRQAPTITLKRAYIASAREFCNKSRWLTLALDPAAGTVAGTAEYDLTGEADLDTEQAEICGIESVKLNDGTEWAFLTEGNMDLLNLNEDADQPTTYEYRPHGLVAFWPTPDAVYDYQVKAVVQPLKTATVISDRLLINWTEALEAGALYRLLRIKGQPWYDKNESAVQYQLFMKEVNAAQSDVANRFNAGAKANPDAVGRPNARIRGRILPI